MSEKPQITRVRIQVAPPVGLVLQDSRAQLSLQPPTLLDGGEVQTRSPTVFFPFVAFFGGLGQFIAGLVGYLSGELLVTVINTMWGALWMSIGLLYYLVATGADKPHGVLEHFPELGSWFVVLAAFTWSGVIAAARKDFLLTAVLAFLAAGSTIAMSLFGFGIGVRGAMKTAAYLWIISAVLAWLRVTIMLLEDAYGEEAFSSMSRLWRRRAPAGDVHGVNGGSPMS